MAGKMDLSAVKEMTLRILSRHELYGLEIIKVIEEATNGKRKFGHSALYPALYELEKKGMVKSHWGQDRLDERGARRKYYKITSLGNAALRDADQIRASLAQWQPTF